MKSPEIQKASFMRIPDSLRSMSFGIAFSAAAFTILQAAPAVYVNQVAYDAGGPKVAVVQADAELGATATFTLIDAASSAVQATQPLGKAYTIPDWFSGRTFYRADFSSFKKAGSYKVAVTINGALTISPAFRIDEQAMAKEVLPSIVRYIRGQRADRPEELAADASILLNDGSKRVDVRGGWDDDAGNNSKYMSHLNYANFFSPQQIPMHAWELADVYERIPALDSALGMADSIQAEALWGADYLTRVLTSGDYFYMVVFDYLNSDVSKRRVGGLLANSVTDNKWQCSFRAAGGMAIAALARISRWNKNGASYTSKNYLDGAKRAFAHLLVNNKNYLYDGKENIMDDYCALMAATELWIATDDVLYQTEARKRAQNLANRVSSAGYFIADDGTRPFWSACDAGLPIWALVRYLDKEKDGASRTIALTAIRKNLDWQLSITNKVQNPFGYARQAISYKGAMKESFFVPHDNETGWWWQGENARLGSLATAAILGGRLVYPADNAWGLKDSLAEYAVNQVSWVLGQNPYAICFMYGFGKTYPPITKSYFGHQSGKGGISNGITGKVGAPDGVGIDYYPPGSDDWRFTEQWIPHAVRMLAATAAMAQAPAKTTGIRARAPELPEAAYAVNRRNGTLEIRFVNPLAAHAKAVLADMNGKSVGAWDVRQGDRSTSIPLPSLEEGIYFLRVGAISLKLELP
ncbi:MAG: glycosyl transferase [Fibrobacteres bacterium]|nr:glycosyl transferase [Fibrobacterota bacterium]